MLLLQQELCALVFHLVSNGPRIHHAVSPSTWPCRTCWLQGKAGEHMCSRKRTEGWGGGIALEWHRRVGLYAWVKSPSSALMQTLASFLPTSFVEESKICTLSIWFFCWRRTIMLLSESSRIGSVYFTQYKATEYIYSVIPETSTFFYLVWNWWALSWAQFRYQRT